MKELRKEILYKNKNEIKERGFIDKLIPHHKKAVCNERHEFGISIVFLFVLVCKSLLLCEDYVISFASVTVKTISRRILEDLYEVLET